MTGADKAKIAATLLVMETFGRYAKKLDETQQEFRERAFIFALKDVPYSCADDAFMEWTSTQIEYPTPAEIKEAAEDKFRVLKQEIFNINRLLENLGKPVLEIEAKPVNPALEKRQSEQYAGMIKSLAESIALTRRTA